MELSARIGADVLKSNTRLTTELEELRKVQEESQKLFITERKTWEEKEKKDEQRINQLEEMIRNLESLGPRGKFEDKSDRLQERQLKNLEKDLVELGKEKEDLLKKFELFEEDRRNWMKEKADLHKELKGQSHLSSYQKELEMVAKRIDELEKENYGIQQSLEASTEKVEFYEKNFDDYDILREELEFLRIDREHQANHINELNAALDSSKEAIQMLHQRLSGEIRTTMLNATRQSMTEEEEEKEGRSLFTEVEDRRVEIESRHRQLQENYGNLMRQHAETRHQKERLKSHVTRLAQLAQHHSLQDKLQRLETSLSTKESELNQVYSRIEKLETELSEYKCGILSLDDLPYDERIAETFSMLVTSEVDVDSKRDAIHYLQKRTECMNYEILWLRAQLKQLKSLKCIHEAKLRELEIDLTRRDLLLDQAQRESSQLKLELEDSFLRIKELEVSVGNIRLGQDQLTSDLSKKDLKKKSLESMQNPSENFNDSPPHEDKENSKNSFNQTSNQSISFSSEKILEKSPGSPSRLIPHIRAGSLPIHSCPQQ